MIIDTIVNRRTIREFKDEPLIDEIIKKIIEAGIQAPSASNQQTWRFLVVKDKEILSKLSKMVADDITVIVDALDPTAKEVVKNYGDYFTRFNQAPAVIFLLRKTNKILSRLCDGKLTNELLNEIDQMEQTSAVLNIGLALQNMMLFAHDIGVGSSCLTGPLISKSKLENHFQIPDGWSLTALLAMGYAVEGEVKSPGRKSLDNCILWHKG